MGLDVIRHLRQFGELPEAGILAGQAVDSALTDLFGAGGGVYNDLDIFRNVPGGPRQGSEGWATRMAGRGEVYMREQSEYAGMEAALELKPLYAIKSVSRKGMLNFVNCSMHDKAQGSGRLTGARVLGGFDLNCTRVGVDLATGELVWDRHYEEFQRSRQLRIVMMHTPWHTFLRLAKKSEELPNVYVDFAAAAEACVAVAQSSAIRSLKASHNVSFLFGERMQERAEAARSIWTPYFNLDKTTLRQHGRHWAEDTPHMAEASPECKTVDLWGLSPRGELDSALQRRCDRLGDGVLFFAQKVVDESRRAKPGNASAKLAAVVASRTAASKNPAGDLVLFCADAFGTDYVQGQALPDIANKVGSWTSKHPGFQKHLVVMTLAEQYRLMQSISTVAREFGNQFFEGDSEHALGVLELRATRADLDDPEKMRELLRADHAANSTPFEVVPLPLPAAWPKQFEGFRVTELLTGRALQREGRQMHHCVGGYSSSIRSNQSRILSIKYLDERTTPNCSTVELRGQFQASATRDRTIRISQNRTLSNEEPSDQNKAFATYVADYLLVVDDLKKEPIPVLVNQAADAMYQHQVVLDAAQSEVARLTRALYDAQRLVRQHEATADELKRRYGLLIQLEGPLEDYPR